MVRSRPRVRQWCLIIGGLAAASAIALSEGFGFDASFLGLRLTVNDPTRAAAIAVLAFLGYLGSGGRLWHPSRTQVRAVLSWFGRLRLPRLPAPRPDVLAAVLAVGCILLAVRYGSHAVGGSDSYGYLSEARLWLTGHVRQPQPWSEVVPWPYGPSSFAPLAYSPSPGSSDLVPVYAAGYPLLMALAMFVGGYRAAFLVSPVAAAVTVWTTYMLGRRLGSRWAGVVGAWLVATSPAFLIAYMSPPMSDVPVTAAWTVALACTIGVSPWSAVVAGLSAGLAVLIRLNLAPIVGVLVLWFVAEAWRARVSGRSDWWQRTAGFAAGLSPFVVLAALINWSLYGSPFRSGYGDVEGWFAVRHVVPNLALYAQWLTETQTTLVWTGIAALFIPARALWARRESGWAAVFGGIFLLALWAEYALYSVFDQWWYLRFLLPAYPFMMLGVGQVVSAISRQGRMLRLAMVVAVLALGVRGVTIAYDRSAFSLRLADSRYATAGRVVREVTPPGSVILSMQHSGSVRFYSGRMTLRYDYIHGRWLDRTVDWLSERGVHTYALLDEVEVGLWRRHFDELNELQRLDWNPIRMIDVAGRTMLYDLVTREAGPTIEVPRDPIDLAIVPPAPRDGFHLRK